MFSNREYADMAFISGECRQNALLAANLYVEDFQIQFRRPKHRMFSTAAGLDRGRPRLILTPQMENQVLELLEKDPKRITRSIAAELNFLHIPEEESDELDCLKSQIPCIAKIAKELTRFLCFEIYPKILLKTTS
ncbi:unnamed protein product [Brassicogethes aeneus]|uniref:DUF4817 domain-containing protein n=1 Tax=Brassicogethes aeneus TaxID=1431903 RepID=A0A9P0B113_BRAAE|nr:unnamed protein product [Brassicogethes aeneus]